jgi:geranylgeranyl diphosphate synthase type II
MDEYREKSTYPALIGLDAARQRARELHADAMDSIAGFDERADPLRWISAYIIDRER